MASGRDRGAPAAARCLLACLQARVQPHARSCGVPPLQALTGSVQQGPCLLRTASGWSASGHGTDRLGAGLVSGVAGALAPSSGRSLSGLSFGSGDNMLARLESTTGDSLGFGSVSRGVLDGFDALEQKPSCQLASAGQQHAHLSSTESQGLFQGTSSTGSGPSALLRLRTECSLDSAASEGSVLRVSGPVRTDTAPPSAAALMSAAPFDLASKCAPWDPPSGSLSVPVGDSGPFASQPVAVPVAPAALALPQAAPEGQGRGQGGPQLPVPTRQPQQASPAPRAVRRPRARAVATPADLPAARPGRAAKRDREPSEPADVTSTPTSSGSGTPMSAMELRRAKGKAPTSKQAGSRPFCCTLAGCGKRFRSKSDLIAHNRVHTGEKPLKCKFAGCGKSFAHCSNLRQHERSHQGIKPYKCSWPGCGKEFAHPTSKKDHEAKHRNERLHVCDQCGKSFTAKANLTRHRKDIHKILPAGSKKARGARAAARSSKAATSETPALAPAAVPVAASSAAALPVSQPGVTVPTGLSPADFPSAPWDACVIGRVVTTSLSQSSKRS